MRNEWDEEQDRILDSALATYSAPDPRPGLEKRVVAKLLWQSPRHAWPRWAVAVPMLAGMLAIVAYWIRPAAPHASAPQRVAQSALPTKHIVQARPATAVAKAVRPRGASASRPGLPKASAFPSPSPLTAEERALVRLAVGNPGVLQNALASGQQLNQPLTVKPI